MNTRKSKQLSSRLFPLAVAAALGMALTIQNCKDKTPPPEAPPEAGPAADLPQALEKKADGKVMPLNTQKSKLTWLGKKVTGKHNGTVAVKSGEVYLDKNKEIAGGKVLVDMTQIKVLDIKDPKYNAKLTNHLKSPDFFEVGKHPTAEFVLTFVEKVKPNTYNIAGNLTIRGQTHNVPLELKVQSAGKGLKATGTLSIDRTLWGVKYRSGKFFEALGDKLIYDDMKIGLELVTK